MIESLTNEEKTILLKTARDAIENAVLGLPVDREDLSEFPERLLEPGATFVTLFKNGELRGCVGGLEPIYPLIVDVREHAIAAALHDYRFPPVQPSELPNIKIEISRLTLPKRLVYKDPDDLLRHLRPRVDGVLIRDGNQRATFLPQVWEKLPEADVFMGNLCLKMGAPADLWRKKKLDVYTYQVEEFHE